MSPEPRAAPSPPPLPRRFSASPADPPTAVPTATYRVQLQPEFPFAAAEEAVPYLAALGVSHLHLSPLLEAVPGSTHGYDVVDHARVRQELGGEQGLRSLARTARAHRLGLVADIVPNHMALPAPELLNTPLWEVLREGPSSPYARWFDIDWAAGGGRVLLPVLAGPLGNALGGIGVEDGTLRCGNHVLPLRAGTESLPLPELLDAQHYRLAWWRLARTELNYRRFFTISELIGVRVEDPEVFEATHATVLRLLREGVLQGLRVDHPDGLADPGGYLRRLHGRTGGAWTVVEKILAPDETLPSAWPVAGTTGYDALHRIDGLLTDPEGAAKLSELYRAFTGAPPDRGGDWARTLRQAAERVVTHELAAETERLTRTAVRICATASDLTLRDHAPWALHTAIRELLLGLPVYRPYTTAGSPVSARDAAMLQTAAERARTVFTVPEEAAAADTVRDLALGRLGTGPDHRDFCARFAQVSSALRAKAAEDCAFYRYAPLLSATEVGGSPARPAVSPDGFHTFCGRLQRDWPGSGTALSTHDTKRSADVRAALAVLTQCPRRWATVLERATRETARTGAPPAPDPHTAWVAWQTAFGCGPNPSPERLVPALLKSVREAGLRTCWTEPDPAYEAAVERFVRKGPGGPGGAVVVALARELAPHIRANVLGAALLQLTMPGVPDIYMGSEAEYLALVDPDNRRPVRLPRALLGALDGGAEPRDRSAEKLRLTALALRLRRERPECFLGGAVAGNRGGGGGTPGAVGGAALDGAGDPARGTALRNAPDPAQGTAPHSTPDAPPHSTPGAGHATSSARPASASGPAQSPAPHSTPDAPPHSTPGAGHATSSARPASASGPAQSPTPHNAHDATQNAASRNAHDAAQGAGSRTGSPDAPEVGSYEPLPAEGEAAAHCVAFARWGLRSGGAGPQGVVTAVTRLSLRLAEAGGWRDTVLGLPPGTWRDVLTGRTAVGRCRVAELFAEAPVALLVSEDG